ncbi:helix-turn-helix domain-containing protein [Klebsiella variicola]|uniref:helix-turn-helix domain-containing protein n=1 Tax=Klebsiella variicola TaxID=244366 RepID=UPI00286D865F|nr:helix-turn-helix transcriptional regulator [Klebsiella variicola]
MLTWARERANLSTSYIALKMKKDPELIERWENGTRPITFNEAQKICRFDSHPFWMSLSG